MNIEETAIMILNMAHKVNKNYKEGKQLFFISQKKNSFVKSLKYCLRVLRAATGARTRISNCSTSHWYENMVKHCSCILM